MSANKTTLVIAHKLATVRAADNIVVMSFGQILEQGSHAELIAKDGAYAALVRAQDLGGQVGQADFSKEEADAGLMREVTLQRTQTTGNFKTADDEIQHLTAGSVGYSLTRCVFQMLREQCNLYVHLAIASAACFVGGGTFVAQALLFSRLIRIFTLPLDEAQNQADFYSLMFFVVAIANWFAYFIIGWICNVVSTGFV